MLPAVLLLAAMAAGGRPVEAQSAGATVRASVTILDGVGVSSGSPMRVLDAGPGEVRIGGSLAVTSPVPHVLTSSVGPADLSRVVRQYAEVRPGAECAECAEGAEGAVPQWVEVRLDASRPGRPVKLVCTIAVVL